jgi:small-conductance mechanosensitive channel
LLRVTRLTGFIAILTLLATVTNGHIRAQEGILSSGSGQGLAAQQEATAPVYFDGRILFMIGPDPKRSAEARAEATADGISDFARDRAIPASGLRVLERTQTSDIMAGARLLLRIGDADAERLGKDRAQLAALYASDIRSAVESYREARSPERLWKAFGLALLATAIFLGAIFLVLRSWRSIKAMVEQRLAKRIPSVKVQTFQILSAHQIWAALSLLGEFLGLLAFLIGGYLYLQFTLRLFPWTQALAERLLTYILDPLLVIGNAVGAEIPNLILILLVVVITRYVLKLTRSFFQAIGRGAIAFAGFEPYWAMPTYRILRILIVAFAVVMIYPYVPGSESAAFQGMTIFLGVVLSLGSTSVISNIIAGHTMTYRRAFRVGDRVRIGETVGDVAEMRLLVTHLRTPRNEMVAVPNSLIMNNQVVNYTALAEEEGIALHRRIAVGYEVPWRKVETLLLEAAGNTEGLVTDPPPFVLQLGFGEFAVNYEINAFCRDATKVPELYTALDRNILDAFNREGVQIMTPAYVADPAEPKLAPFKPKAVRQAE